MNNNEVIKGMPNDEIEKSLSSIVFYAKASNILFAKNTTTKVLEVVSNTNNWTCYSNASWITVTKASVHSNNANETVDNYPMGAVKITVSANNTGITRSSSIRLVCQGLANDIQISIVQTWYNTPSIDLSSNIYYMHQTKPVAYDGNCPGACCCMIYKQAMCSVDHVHTDSAQWSWFAQQMNKTASDWQSISYGDMSDVYDLISAGTPVIVGVNQSNPHYVLVTGYSGNDITSPSNYFCADPWRLDLQSCALTSAENYSQPYRYYYFY